MRSEMNSGGLSRWWNRRLVIPISIIRAYQLVISPIFRALGAGCRFYPSCSEYALTAYKRHGILKGTLFSIRRLARCHPLSDGGIDMPMEAKEVSRELRT
jgi:putative membrane protein insertion efficiency factor